MAFFDFLKDTIGIDAGSTNLRIVKDGKLIFNEKSELSFDLVNQRLIGMGNSVKETSGVIKPVNYVIADFQGFEVLLRGAIQKGLNRKSSFPRSYKMYFAVPTSTTETEKRAYRDSAEHVGAVETYMVDQSCCAAVAMDLLFEQKHFILIDFGASKIEMTVFADSLAIAAGVTRMGTAKIFQILKNHARRKYSIEIDADEMHSLFSALSKSLEEVKIQFKTVNLREIRNLLYSFFTVINDELLETLEFASNHAKINSILTNGIYFTGGGSAIDFLRSQITFGDDIRRTTSQDPLLDNINGLSKVIANKDTFKRYIMT